VLAVVIVPLEFILYVPAICKALAAKAEIDAFKVDAFAVSKRFVDVTMLVLPVLINVSVPACKLILAALLVDAVLVKALVPLTKVISDEVVEAAAASEIVAPVILMLPAIRTPILLPVIEVPLATVRALVEVKGS